MTAPASQTASLENDGFAPLTPNDTGSTEMRRAASAISTIARMVGNSIRERAGIEQGIAPLNPYDEAALLDALEFVAKGLAAEAMMVDDHAQMLAKISSPRCRQPA